MKERILTIEKQDLNNLSEDLVQQTTHSLESGQVIYLPQYTFQANLKDKNLFLDSILDGKHKNASYDYQKQNKGKKVAGTKSNLPAETQAALASFMHQFAEYSRNVVDSLFPQYSEHLIWGRTSYRPAEIEGRKSSPRKDDTRLHVDAFPSTPVNGFRILRVFCNVNPHGKPRVWELGEPFEKVLARFAPTVPPYRRLHAKMLHWFKATKSFRTHYDHMMLYLHDNMKLDAHYQRTLDKQRVDFPANSTWMVFTDLVSHAVLSGQHLLEQTFYLPISGMKNPHLSPYHQCKRILETQV